MKTLKKQKINIVAKIFSPRSAFLCILRESGGVLYPGGGENVSYVFVHRFRRSKIIGDFIVFSVVTTFNGVA